MEAELVVHSGRTAKGSYVKTLTLTDIATRWTECAAWLVPEQRLLTKVLIDSRKILPFAPVGFDVTLFVPSFGARVRPMTGRTDEAEAVSEEQIIGILKEADAGAVVLDLCRKDGMSSATFYPWKSKYGGLEISEARRLRGLEEENTSRSVCWRRRCSTMQ